MDFFRTPSFFRAYLFNSVLLYFAILLFPYRSDMSMPTWLGYTLLIGIGVILPILFGIQFIVKRSEVKYGSLLLRSMGYLQACFFILTLGACTTYLLMHQNMMLKILLLMSGTA